MRNLNEEADVAKTKYRFVPPAGFPLKTDKEFEDLENNDEKVKALV